jgi:hypothetical protein
LDTSDFQLLRCVAEGQLHRIDGELTGLVPDQRGSTYVRFFALHIEAIRTLIDSVSESYASSDDLMEQTVLGRKLYRLKFLLDQIHSNVFDYKGDVGRRDLPVGLLYLTDALVVDLLKASADPLIHLDGLYMYSTQRIKVEWEKLSNELGVVWSEDAEPIVFNLPGLDPTNAFLSPILAHEVGHSVIQRQDLVNDLEGKLDGSEVERLKSELSSADPSVGIDDALSQFQRWAEELLCDALATELTGPSLLFSSAVFLPASAAGQSGRNHPDAGQRIALTLRQMELGGWIPLLEHVCPVILEWLRTVALVPPVDNSPREGFLRSLVDLAQDAIAKIASDHVGSSLSSASYEAVEGEMSALLAQGIPPADLPGGPVSVWQIVNACWLHGIVGHGDNSVGLAEVVTDEQLSNFTLKTVEMASVLNLWRVE